MRSRLKSFICADLLRNPDYQLGDTEPLMTGGLMDSFALAQVGVFVESAFNVYIPDIELTVDNMNTVDAMVRCIMQHSAGDASHV
ncbi:MAG: hypothetical protein HYX76_07210 [Acidobacteria bacterium]|nr:hypothetical protein [Acidobacteriota bacterium]